MPLPRGLPVVDHHCHLSPAGEGVGAARRFRAAGGTHLFLATQNYGAVVPRTVEEYREQFGTTEALSQRIAKEAEVTAYPVVAPYPIDLVQLAPTSGLASAVAVQKGALDLAGTWVRERRAVAIGEVGRAHFPVDASIAAAIEEVFRYAMEIARDSGCPIVVHSEDLDAPGYDRLAGQAREIGLDPHRVVKHYARQRVPPEQRNGVAASYLAKRALVAQVEGDAAPWFLETDFLDDPARPGAVLDLATVPRRAAEVAARGDTAADRLWVPFSESVERVYGFRPQPIEARRP